MNFNFATTLSFCAATTCGSLALLWAYLGRAPSSRHFRYAAAASGAAALYCLANVVIGGRFEPGVTVWAGQLNMLAAAAHGAAWLAFIATWGRRRLSPFERLITAAALLAGLASLVPGLAVDGTLTERPIAWAGFVYRDPGPGPLALPFLVLVYTEQVLAALAALRMTRSNPKARVVAAGLGIFCVVTPVDILSGLHLVNLPYLSDPAVALVAICVGLIVTRDAAESAAKSAALERAQESMAERESLAALGQLAAVVAHEVRNPVAVIFGALAPLQRGARNEEDTRLLTIVQEEADRLRQMVTRLLDAVRPFELQYSRQDVGPVVSAAIEQVTAATGVARAQVELTNTASEQVECDVVLLGQAISNLVHNAVVANGRRSPVRVRSAVEPSQPATLRVEVADDGEGVALDARPRLFTPFFTTRATGTGLGLALVKRIAGAHGGTVDHECPPGGGATFVLRVPLRARDGSPKRLLGGELR